MSETLLEVKDLVVSFHTYAGKVQAVRGVSFSMDKGEILAVVGESGCGKSVTAKTIMRLNPTPPAEIEGGQILLEGKDLTKLKEREMYKLRGKKIGMIFQDPMTSLDPTKKSATRSSKPSGATSGFPIRKRTSAASRCWNWWASTIRWSG